MTRSRGLLLCSTAVLLTFSAASQAATPASDETAPALATNSYADLLAPIPNATALLEADNLARAQAASQPRLQLAQYHHHHHHYHHHHHHSYFPWGVIPGFGAPPPVYYHRRHCYWAWGDPYWNGYRWVRRHIRVCD